MKGRKSQGAAVKDAKGNPGKRRRPGTTRSKAPLAAGNQPPAPAIDAKPTPSIERGSPGASAASPPKPAGGIPRELTVAGKAVWKIVAPLLTTQKLFKATDRIALARYCDTVAEYWKVTRMLRRQKYVYDVQKVGGGKMLRFNPLFMIQDRIGRRLDVLEDRFGFTPRSRQELEYRLATQLPQLPLGDPDAPRPAAEPTSPVGFVTPADGDGSRRVH